jgi:hypothetical protein
MEESATTGMGCLLEGFRAAATAAAFFEEAGTTVLLWYMASPEASSVQ